MRLESQAKLEVKRALRQKEAMSKDASREERLAAKLRENLKRRKTQARAKSNPSETKPHLSKPACDS